MTGRQNYLSPLRMLGYLMILTATNSILLGQSANPSRFEVASIKVRSQPSPGVITGALQPLPGGRLVANEALLRFLIQNAYSVRSYQVIGGPDWINTTHYDIEAKATDNPTPQQMLTMLQGLLEERFKLKVHRETRELPVYELTEGRNGPKLEPAKAACRILDSNAVPSPPPLPPPPGAGPQPLPGAGPQPLPPPPLPSTQTAIPICTIQASVGTSARLVGINVTTGELARVLSNMVGRTVIDKTNYKSSFDVHLEFVRDQTLAGLGAPDAPTPDPTNVSLFTAIQEQLGLKLDSARGPVDVVVVDSVERTAFNSGACARSLAMI